MSEIYIKIRKIRMSRNMRNPRKSAKSRKSLENNHFHKPLLKDRNYHLQHNAICTHHGKIIVTVNCRVLYYFPIAIIS